MVEGSSLAGAGALAADNFVKVYKAAWIFTKKPLLRGLNCQRASPLWHFRKRRKIRLHRSDERFGCVCASQPLAAHTTEQPSTRETGKKWEC